MQENQPSPEAQGILDEAVNGVIELYKKDKRALLDTPSTVGRDNSWKETAEKFPVFSKTIKELGEALKEANEKKKKHSDIAITQYPQLFFGNMPDDVKEFLADIWCSRIAVPENPNLLMDTGYSEAQDMRQEITKKKNNGRFCEIQPKTNLTEVMGSVLQGKLKLTHQPKQIK